MRTAFDILDIPTDATDEQIRNQYLELVRQFPPEQNSEKFAEIRAAYELIKTPHARATYQLYLYTEHDCLDEFMRVVENKLPRARFGLSQLLAVHKPTNR